MDASRAPEAPVTVCPNCRTPRGPYDRFCTGCAADLGAPGAPIGNIGTLGAMSVAGPSSRQTRAQAAPPPRNAAGWVVPGVRSRPTAQGPTPGVAQGGQLSGIGGYPAPSTTSAGGDRLWRTLGFANRLIAVLWIIIVLTALANYLSVSPDATTAVGVGAVIVLFALPSLALWLSAPLLIRGEPSWLRSIVLIEWMVIVIASFGLALVPLLVIFLLSGDGFESR